MRVIREGERGKAGCPFDEKLVSITYRLSDVPSSSGKPVRGVLAGVCDTCGKVISVPQQSVPRIREQLTAARKPLEARLPVHVVDLFYSSCSELGGSDRWQDWEIPMLRYYVNWLAHSKDKKSIVERWLGSPVAKGRANDRISAKVDVRFYDAIKKLSGEVEVKTSDLLKAVILQMADDVQSGKKNKRVRELEEAIATISGART
jgi:hypothetical protein